MIEPVLANIDENFDAKLNHLKDLLKIKSISTDPAFAVDCDAAADWLVSDLQSIGFDASKRQTPGHPMVVAHHDGPGPHILFYGHYDVQPVDPIALWESDPFDPQIIEADLGPALRARGSSDDKGQIMTFVEACRSWKSVHGTLPCKITVFLEGEEESSSPSLVPFMEANKDELSADLVLICDTTLFGDNTPAIVTQLRGLLGEEFTIHGPKMDLHSGFFGGAAMNPGRVLAKIIASLHDDAGRITIPGFYDDVESPSPEVLDQWNRLDFNTADFLGAVGLSEPAGETSKSVLEMIWSRPTCEVNGMECGYTGEGFKTVLPAQASAKVSFRLVPGQDPHKIRDSFRKMVEGMIPKDCSVEWIGHGTSRASQMATDHPAFESARAALSDEWGVEAAFIGCGGSIPIAGHFQNILGLNSMLIGFGRENDAIHSPNEKYDLRSFQKGMRSWVRILDKISRG